MVVVFHTNKFHVYVILWCMLGVGMEVEQISNVLYWFIRCNFTFTCMLRDAKKTMKILELVFDLTIIL